MTDTADKKPEKPETANPTTDASGEVLVRSIGIARDMPFFTKTLGFRLEQIFPADDPSVAVLFGHGLRLRLDSNLGDETPLPILCLRVQDPHAMAGGAPEITAPNGMRIQIEQRDPPLVIPQTKHQYIVRRLADQAPWVIGRAGMHYRDLIPDRLGGSIIASHIRIPDGGPVPDMVHYHTVGFQLIFCVAGWVDLVYEDQGPEFRLHAGDCVIQPPEIRHRVLFASPNIEVVEIGVPAEHVTTIDHSMELPNGPANPDRRFGGQRFVHHRKSEAVWQDWRIPGFMARDTGIAGGTGGVAGVKVARWQGNSSGGDTPFVKTRHDCDILFNFVMTGTMRLRVDGEPDHALQPGDAFVVPPGRVSCFDDCSADLELIEVALAADFKTDLIS
jgi:quercetin dioxygenase-like cupin family protein